MIYRIFLLFTLNSCLISCLPHVIRGRPPNKYGMVGIPVRKETAFAAIETQAMHVTQRLNHFDPLDNRKWEQRYWTSDSYYKTDGPVFLFLSGESEGFPGWLTDGEFAKNAKKHNAKTVLLEHRYYGESHPTEDLSVENMKFLSSRQALEDTAFFIDYFTAKHSLNGSQWVVFGGSYAGALAAWFRSKYPHLVVGAVASSAPIDVELNFKEYLGVVSESLGQKCVDAIKEATNRVSEELKTPEGCDKITKQFNLCSPLKGTDTNDVRSLMSSLAAMVEDIVQNNRNVGFLMGSVDIGTVCSIMLNENDCALSRYTKLIATILESKGSSCLRSSYMYYIKFMSETARTSTAVQMGMRQWFYQMCNEFGYFETSDLATQPFGQYNPVDFYLQQCRDIFGAQYTPEVIRQSVENTNKFYGGLGISVRKVVFPNGSLDPWHALGVLKDLNDDALAVYINGTSHCADMYPESDSDPKSLTDARLRISDALDNILNGKALKSASVLSMGNTLVWVAMISACMALV